MNDISRRFGAAMLTRSRVPVVPALTAGLTMAITFALAVGTGPARADTRANAVGQITIHAPVTVIALGGAGGERLAVTADSATPLTSMTVHLLSATPGRGLGADTLDLPMRPSPPRTPPPGTPPGTRPAGAATWMSGEITPRRLPLGNYALTADAADQGGDAVRGIPAGAFPFLDTPRIAPAAGDYVISAANRHPLIGGTITELAPGASTPIPYANRPIVLGDPLRGDMRLTTNSAGAYREALPRPVAGETITAEVLPTATTQAARARPVLLTVRTAITGFGARLNPYWQVSWHGCLGLAPGTPGPGPPLSGLTIQYSASPHGPWRTLGRVASQRGHACGNAGRTFAGVLATPASGAYYRAGYPGTAAPQKTAGDLPTASSAVHAWKYSARIPRFAVSRRTVPGGGQLTASGRLQYESDGIWHSLAHQVVQIILLPEKSRTWYWIARVKTSASGGFTATFTDPVTATWSAEYLGDRTHLAAVGAMISVTLK